MATVTAHDIDTQMRGLPADVLYEVVDGVVREAAPMSTLAVLLASALHRFLGPFAHERRLGLSGVELLFRLSQDSRLQRRPDVAFVAYDRVPEPLIAPDDPPAWNVVPNFAVEVVSPTNLAEEMLDRVREYLGAGVELVWIIYPRHQEVHVYDGSPTCRIVRADGELDGGKVLPGFRVKIADLYASLAKPT